MAEQQRVNPKPEPNRRLYLEVLRRMTPEQRLAKCFELSAMAKALFIQGLRQRYPDVGEAEFKTILLERLRKCHNRNY
jgi:hypothetical protein